jgi:hypothetical protein
MTLPKIQVHHWHYNDGIVLVPPLLRLANQKESEFCAELVGWHCCVYTNDYDGFFLWMEKHCPRAECISRFNSGDPMITVHISDQEEAAYFKLHFQT